MIGAPFHLWRLFRTGATFERTGAMAAILDAMEIRGWRRFAIHAFVWPFGRFGRTGNPDLPPLPRALQAPGHVEEDQFSGPGRSMMAANHADELGRVIGDRLGVEDAVRPEAAAGVIGPLPGAVGVHGEQSGAECVGDIGVFPAGIEHASVAHHGGIEVVILIEAQSADVRTVVVHDAEVGHLVISPFARDRLETGRGTEQDPIVPQVARV
ncbi:MAG: hypothetical protein V3R90_12950, partial [Limibaculum sp.]